MFAFYVGNNNLIKWFYSLLNHGADKLIIALLKEESHNYLYKLSYFKGFLTIFMLTNYSFVTVADESCKSS